ncbi:iron chelate uptake ABC transporter family permease subunit [Corynebacterium hansenii]|uniref:Iron chelate uptake ABC transporter family permease subunit n=1 Tax=Corynebacterium hansenii TaxID=394964 RepID=A0ABV7ZRF9_9CORY|nr:iron chelate uptake ABC transporter family permease subunit [Corynebacterium hansenii]WJY99872.1 Iron-uptake system permease protein FeuC [Corynebacterium hansenii]
MSTAIDRTTPRLPDGALAELSGATGVGRSGDPTGQRPVTAPLPTARARRRYRVIFAVLLVLAAGFATATLAWDNPMPFGSRGFLLIAEMRASNLAVMAVVAFCQATATIAFQTVTHNRILTPSIMGFESLYTVIQTAAVFFLGAAGVVAVTGTPQFLGQVAIMVTFSAILYGWLFGGRFGNLQIMLLVGIILGGGLGALSTVMQRMMTPSDFDVLTARLIGSIANADTDYLLVSLPIVAFAGGVLWLRSTKLNVLGLGRETAVNLGLDHKKDTIVVLVMVSMLMAVSTAMVGPMTFLGFLVAMIAYQLADTYDHRHVFPIAWLTGFTVLCGSYFVLKNFFYAEGSVGIIIEIVGGTFFLIHILRKGRL